MAHNPSQPTGEAPEVGRIIPPSENYKRNKETFAYRLSELVFGSLLASYVLGFVGFVAVYVQPAKELVLRSSRASINLSEYLDASHTQIDVSKLLSLLTIDSDHKALGVVTIANVPFRPDGSIILHYLLISALFSMLTALLYFNYHRIIMHLTSNQQTSAVDFLLSLLIGVAFGLSMLMPLGVIFFLSLLVLIALLRKWTLLRPYWLDIAIKKKLVATHADQSHANTHRKNQAKARSKVAETFRKSSNETLKSWGEVAPWPMWLITIAGLVIPAAICAWAIEQPLSFPISIDTLLIANLVICTAVLVFVFIWLFASNEKMASPDSEVEAEFDMHHADVLASIPSRLQ